jgi:hypothetical protein
VSIHLTGRAEDEWESAQEPDEIERHDLFPNFFEPFLKPIPLPGIAVNRVRE